ncbi:hypothetical protein C5S29_15785 [ANME-1 cluster archaeon GoMg3.2]|nr:hypothetical protein [ANME-1 cluster archaeon GoMg3.2]
MNILIRARFITDYRDFIRVLFRVGRERNYREILKLLRVSAGG